MHPLNLYLSGFNLGWSNSPPSDSLCERINILYAFAVQKAVGGIEWTGLEFTSKVVGTIIAEPWLTVKAGIDRLKGIESEDGKPKFGLNPQTITAEQAQKNPIILCHGNGADPSAFLSLAEALENSGLGPLYTVTLPPGDITDRDHSIMENVIREIDVRYAEYGVENPQYFVVGHSRGSTVGYEAALRTGRVSKLIQIGAVCTENELDTLSEKSEITKIYEITARYDVLERMRSALDPWNQLMVNAGHLGLLYSSSTHGKVIEWLKGY